MLNLGLMKQGRDYDYLEYQCTVIRDEPYSRTYTIDTDYHDPENFKKLQQLVNSADYIKRIDCKTIIHLHKLPGITVNQVIIDLKSIYKE